MQYSPRLDDLKVLDCFLQDQLHDHMGRVVPFQVQCVFKDDVLWVLCQHPQEIVIDTQETFRVLEKILQAEQPATQLPVKLYLRTVGTKQPYSTEKFTIYPLVRDRLTGEAAPAIDETDLYARGETPDPTTSAELPPPNEQVSRAQQILDRLGRSGDVAAVTPAISGNDLVSAATFGEDTLVDEGTIEQMSLANTDPDPSSGILKSKSDDVEAFANDVQSAFSPPAFSKPKFNVGGWLLGGGVSLAAIGLGIFGATRPCVLGTCPQIQQSQSLVDKSLATIARPSSGKEILDAQADMRQSIATLKTIPFWSGSYAQAQTDLKNSERQSAMLDIAVEGMNKAYRASEPTKKQPVSQAAWKESQKLWEGAIADLEKVSTDSDVYPLAQQKLVEYQQKLDSIKQNITSEVNADKNLDSAKLLSLATSQKQPQAKSLEQWQALQKDWKNLNDLIVSIPEGSSAYAEAQTLKKLYQPQISVVDTKLEKEKTFGGFYEKAETAGQAAKKFQKDEKLDESLAQWNTALSALQKIPTDSTYQADAQKLTTEYTAAMQKVEVTLVSTRKKAQATEDLKKTCDGKPQVCSYQIADKAITVKLLPEYAKTVRQTALSATKQGDENAKLGLIKHLQSLGTALEAVSDNSRIPIQLYFEDGKLLQSYTPRKS
jgi:hypothetical protein